MQGDTLVLALSDGTKYNLSSKALELSEFLKKKIGENKEDKEIKVEEIEKDTMDAVVKFLKHYESKSPPVIEAPLSKPDLKSCISDEEDDSFSIRFIQSFSMDNLANLCIAAELLEINPLLDLCCAKIASMCKEKDEIDAILNKIGGSEISPINYYQNLT